MLLLGAKGGDGGEDVDGLCVSTLTFMHNRWYSTIAFLLLCDCILFLSAFSPWGVSFFLVLWGEVIPNGIKHYEGLKHKAFEQETDGSSLLLQCIVKKYIAAKLCASIIYHRVCSKMMG